jgi:hypothetical protein
VFGHFGLYSGLGMLWLVCLYKLGLSLVLRRRTLEGSLLGGKFCVRLPGLA